jgi:hypothetical protein
MGRLNCHLPPSSISSTVAPTGTSKAAVAAGRAVSASAHEQGGSGALMGGGQHPHHHYLQPSGGTFDYPLGREKLASSPAATVQSDDAPAIQGEDENCHGSAAAHHHCLLLGEHFELHGGYSASTCSHDGSSVWDAVQGDGFGGEAELSSGGMFSFAGHAGPWGAVEVDAAYGGCWHRATPTPLQQLPLHRSSVRARYHGGSVSGGGGGVGGAGVARASSSMTAPTLPLAPPPSRQQHQRHEVVEAPSASGASGSSATTGLKLSGGGGGLVAGRASGAEAAEAPMAVESSVSASGVLPTLPGVLRVRGHTLLSVHALPEGVVLELPAGSVVSHPVNMCPDTW